MDKNEKFSTFYLDGLWFGIKVEEIQEVLRYLEITPVPLAPPAILGLINLRGQIITAIDLRRRLGLSELAVSRQSINIVVRGGEDTASFLVDTLGEVVEVEKETLETPPDTIDAANRVLIRGVHKLKDGLMHIVNTEEAMRLVAEGI
jgi:purine-binding chemotaxis protein CheW